MVTVVPAVPEAGEMEVIEGGFTVNVLAAEVPTRFVTCTGMAPAVRPSGTVQVIAVSDQEVTAASVPLNVTDPCVAPKYLPLIVTAFSIVPEAGEMDRMEGGLTV